eukprot:TRINITY_DN6630_c0_g1_i1.p1 TRINITY_DN6630_c0_g1~~TRINITY_DN6630_c0_g1_i1.p1  ORF type:complete len:356 (-),score=51.59 TRINITY_DN6630_c0_g1_i1:70-1137(-)
MAASPISGIPVSILLGMAINNFVLPSFPQLKQQLTPGLNLSSKLILQLGIICVGLKLSALDVIALGGTVFPCVVLAIATGLSFTAFLSRRLGLPPRMGLLIGAGTSICGVTAITAMAPSLKANPQEVSFAVATVVGFGTFGMLFYPYLAHFVFNTPEQVGLFLGLAIHDTSQVLGSAITYSQVYNSPIALQWATVTKLSRNICLGLVIPILSSIYARQEQALENPEASSKNSWFSLSEFKKHVPMFVYGFLGMALIRTIGDAGVANSGLALGVISPGFWKCLTHLIGGKLGTCFLGTAMAAVGLNTNFSVLRGVGVKPFVAGFGGALAMGVLASLLGFGLQLGEGNDSGRESESE